jgi:cobalamin biosynthesis protein CobD/CbiB
MGFLCNGVWVDRNLWEAIALLNPVVWKNEAMKTLNQKNKQIEKQPLDYYLNLQYPVTLYPNPAIARELSRK